MTACCTLQVQTILYRTMACGAATTLAERHVGLGATLRSSGMRSNNELQRTRPALRGEASPLNSVLCGPQGDPEGADVTDRWARFGLIVGALAITWLGGAVPAHSKCAALIVDVTAQVSGDVPDGFDAVVYSRPDGAGKTPTLNRETGELKITLWFDAFKSLSLLGGHNCSRKPKEVGLRVLVGGVERANVVMLFPEHFVRGADDHWTNKRPLTIELGPTKDASHLAGPHNNELQRTRPAQAMEPRR